METSILQKFKKRADRLISPAFLQTGRVLEVRNWEASGMIEVDLHLPAAEMQQWREVPYIKFKVAEFTFRDYTPAGWDADISTCTLFIDTAHNGPGSQWARLLKAGNAVQYLKIDTTRQAPDATSLIVGLGDESSIGHLLALQQLVLPKARYVGAVAIADEKQRTLFDSYFKSPVRPVERDDEAGDTALMRWVTDQGFCIPHTSFYLTGNHYMVSRLRHALKDKGYIPGRILAKGFWS